MEKAILDIYGKQAKANQIICMLTLANLLNTIRSQISYMKSDLQ